MNADQLVSIAQVRALVRSGAARSIRQAAGLSLGEVARALGVSPSTVFRWEHAQRSPHGDAGIAYGRLLSQLMRGDAS